MSQTKPKITSLDEHLQLVDTVSEEFVVQSMLASGDTDRLRAYFTFFYQDLPAYRLSMLNEDWVIDRLWDALRGRQAAFDAVLDMTSVAAGVAAVQEGGWEGLEKSVIKAMSIHGDNRMVSFMDAEELSEFCSEEKATELVKINPWLCTLYLLRLTPSYREGLTAFLNPKKTSDAE